MALNSVGLAACQLSKLEPNLRKALDALNQAFLIRYQVLGPPHVDTIATLNNMAGVYLHLGNLPEARQAYLEVWTMRQAVFGPNHPSVAVTAHALGGVYLRMSRANEASKYYFSAFDIFRQLGLNEDHPCVARLLSDIDRLGRVTSCLN
jgi:tetratricopeptide (TPR) repeat protein